MNRALPGPTGMPSTERREAPSFTRLASGDPAALDELLERYWPPLLSYLRSLLGDEEAAKDIAQDTFIYIWEGRARWTAEGSVRALLYRVARSRALNHVRYDRVRERSAPLIGSLHSQRGWAATPLQVLEQAELRSAIEEAIEALPPRRREVFTLAYLHGCRHAEVAEIMGISVQTARNQMSAALADLRRTLEPFL